MLSEFEQKMLSRTGVNDDKKTQQLVNYLTTQFSRKVYISNEEYKNTLLGSWLKKNGLNKTNGSGWKTNTNYLLRMSKQGISNYANYFIKNNLDDVYLMGSYAKKYKIEEGNNTFATDAIMENFNDAYAFDFFLSAQTLLFYYGKKYNGMYVVDVTESDIIEDSLDYIELEFEYYGGISDMHSDNADYTIFDYIAINEPQRQYIDDRGLFEVRDDKDGSLYAVVLSYVDETSNKYLVLSNSGAINLYDPENDGFMSLEDLEETKVELAIELEDLIKGANNPALEKLSVDSETGQVLVDGKPVANIVELDLTDTSFDLSTLKLGDIVFVRQIDYGFDFGDYQGDMLAVVKRIGDTVYVAGILLAYDDIFPITLALVQGESNVEIDDYFINFEIGGDLTVDGDARLFENIIDNEGRKRFLEGNGSSLNQAGVNITYCKWSLSGTHLMLVAAGTIADETVITNGTVLATFQLPSWIHDKIYPVWGGDRLEIKPYTLTADNWSTQTSSTVLTKSASTRALQFVQSGALTLTATRGFRIVYDLLIDNAQE